MSLLKASTHPKLLGYVGLLIPLVIQAALLHPYHAENPAASLFRRSLIPIAVIMTFVTAPLRNWQPLEDSMMINFLNALVTFHAACLAFEYGLHDGPVLGSECPSADATGSYNTTSGDPNEVLSGETRMMEGILTSKKMDTHQGHKSQAGQTASNVRGQAENINHPKPSTGALLRFVVWLLFSPRGLECHWAPHPSILSFRKPISTSGFIRETITRTLTLHVYGTLYWALATYAFYHPDGFYGLIKDLSGLPDSSVVKLIAGYGTSFCLAACMWAGLEIAAGGMNLFEFLFYSIGRQILPQEWSPEKPYNPRRYPPLFSKPWSSKSMSKFWGSGWHALFRRDLIYCGGLPAAKLTASLGGGRQAQKMASLMGAMFLSGIMHEYAVASISPERPELQIIWFFMKCAIIMAVENLVEKHTKFKFQGFWGHLWTFSFLMYFGKPGLDAWMERGLGKRLLKVSQWRWSQILFPGGFDLPSIWFNQLPF